MQMSLSYRKHLTDMELDFSCKHFFPNWTLVHSTCKKTRSSRPGMHTKAGVTTLVRNTLGHHVIYKIPGRYIHIQIHWGGLHLQIANVYLPNAPKDQHQFLNCLYIILQSYPNQNQIVWGGDYTLLGTLLWTVRPLPDARLQQPRSGWIILILYYKIFPLTPE